MKERRELPTHGERGVPSARVSRKYRFTIIWVVPLIAAAIAGWLVLKNLKQHGPTVMVRFSDGKSLEAGQTLVRYRGVAVGLVKAVRLSKDANSVEVAIRLETSVASFAREGARYWIVRPDVSAGSFKGLDTLVAGPYIQAQPGSGEKRKEFVGLEQAPIIAIPDGGLDITLTWPQLGFLNPGSPIYYRGVEVGVVQDFQLGELATNIIIHAHIQPQFSALVRADSLFWNAGGIKADLGLFGVSVSAESLKSLLVGGIAFATPSKPGPPVASGATFVLHEKGEEKWLKWAPAIEIGPQTNTPVASANVNLDSLNPGRSTAAP